MAWESDIIDGPEKMDLMLALFDGGPTKIPRPVRFKLKDNPKINQVDKHINVVISEVFRESGDFESWGFQGELTDGTRAKVKGFFSTKNRTGYIQEQS